MKRIILTILIGVFCIGWTSEGGWDTDGISADNVRMKNEGGYYSPECDDPDNDVECALQQIGAGGGGVPGGADTNVQFNDGGVFAGESTFIYNKGLNSLSIDRIVIGPGVADYLMPTVRGGANELLVDNGAGAVSWTDDLVIDTLDLEGYGSIGNGSALNTSYSLVIDRNFTDTGNDNVAQLMVAGDITKTTFAPGTNMSFIQAGTDGIEGPSAGITIDGVSPPVTSTMTLYEPNITEINVGAALVAATLYIKDAPTEGTSNYALKVDDGAVVFDSTLLVGGTSTLGDDVNVTGNITASNTIKGCMLRQDNVWHVYGGFQDETETIDLPSATWTQVTNSTSNLWVGLEADGFSVVNDRMVIGNPGDYFGLLSLTFSGLNGKDFLFRVYNVTQSTVMGYHLGASTTSVANFVNVAVPIYFESLLANDELEFQAYSSDGADPTIRSSIFYINYLHD